ncbi:hypothetical protein [Hydrogenophaga palleronii]|uniref:hypothetical protein n=1 Tax=Hydrogenophaga palleronii TaxID=65655 RepID=UPI000825A9C2|nr:hypothetical protein [Hydrogenophaga palleronii]
MSSTAHKESKDSEASAAALNPSSSPRARARCTTERAKPEGTVSANAAKTLRPPSCGALRHCGDSVLCNSGDKEKKRLFCNQSREYAKEDMRWSPQA